MRIAVMMIAVIALLIACGNQEEKRPEELVAPEPTAVKGPGTDEIRAADRPAAAAEQDRAVEEEAAEPIEYGWGETHPAVEASGHRNPSPLSLSERILRSDVIARARLTSVAPSSWWYYYGQHKAYAPAVAFTFDVKEALYGSPGDSVVVGLLLSKPWENQVPAEPYKTEAKALEVSGVWNESRRVTEWDERDAIIFLSLASNVSESWADGVPSTVQYVFVSERSIGGNARMSEDEYTIHSPKNQVWLPAVSVGEAGSQTFYLDDPKIVNLPATNSLADLKTAITTATAKIESSIPGYRECLLAKEQDERDGRPTYPPAFWSQIDKTIASGLPTDTVLSDLSGWKGIGGYPNLFLEGPDSTRFKQVLSDTDTNPENRFDVHIHTTRPLPFGVYEIHTNHQTHRMKPCNYVPPYRVKWLVTVEPPDGTLHELFFDPGTDGSAVTADNMNGVLKPTSFTDANGASATLSSISYESSTVMMTLSPHNGLTGHILDFIELDGTVSLSLNVGDATVDSANNTLSWTVSEQPWHDGDKLMVRIRDDRK